MQPIRIFTCVWGEHVEWFERALVKSFCWPANKTALDLPSTKWSIFTKKDHIERVQALASKVLSKEQSVIEIFELPERVQGSSPETGSVILSALLHVMKQCLAEGSKLLMAPPDTMFGDGSIPNLIKIGAQSGVCVAVAHPRVSPSVFAQIPAEEPITNASLVTKCWKHLHESWRGAEIGLEQSNSFVGGVAWRKLSNDLIAVQHRLPTIYLADFVPSDLAFFQQPHGGKPPTFGTWDHGWPAECLIKQQRQRLIGSSDAAFICEITAEDKNIPPVTNANFFEPDAFWRDLEHNRHNRQQVIIFRGE